jgi:hypothetical protein
VAEDDAGEAQQVWMVHARTGMDGVPGSLTLAEGAIVFQPAGGKSAETVLPLSAIVLVKRAPGSPVLQVNLELTGAPKVIGFYFTRPPDISKRAEGFKMFQRYLARRRAIGDLRRGNVARGDEVSEWVARIRAAKAATEG